jgi:hypothetical protein
MEPEKNKTGIITKLIATSYEIICDTERRPPNNAYFELLLQPANKIVYTPIDDIIKIYKRLRLKSTK